LYEKNADNLQGNIHKATNNLNRPIHLLQALRHNIITIKPSRLHIKLPQGPWAQYIPNRALEVAVDLSEAIISTKEAAVVTIEEVVEVILEIPIGILV